MSLYANPAGLKISLETNLEPESPKKLSPENRDPISILFCLFATGLIAGYLAILRQIVGPDRMLEAFTPCILFGTLGFFLAGHQGFGSRSPAISIKSRIKVGLMCGIFASVCIELLVGLPA